ncbi:MAG: ABC transporter permease [Candidatus Babeliales bacterium]
MIAWAPIWAVVLRHTRMLRRDANFMLACLYWPLLDVFIWGVLGAWVQQSHVAEFQNYKIAALFGVLLWQIIGRGCMYMTFAFTEELMSNNITNLFTFPLAITQWMSGVIVFTSIMLGMTLSSCMLFMYLLYDISLYQALYTLLIFCLPLFFCCLWVGFTCLQIIILLGKRGIEFSFVVCWTLLPFSGAYYPIEALPAWGQKFSTLLPMSYLFQGMRGYVMQHQDPTPYLIKGYVLSIAYATCAILLFVYCFNHSKKKGLARLAD